MIPHRGELRKILQKLRRTNPEQREAMRAMGLMVLVAVTKGQLRQIILVMGEVRVYFNS